MSVPEYFKAGFTGTGIVRHPTKAGWFLRHLGGNRWDYTKCEWEAVILWDAELARMLRMIPGSTWMPTKPWLEQPDGSCKNGWKHPIPKEWGGDS